jgi:CSLREA domain-containing protein
VLTLALVALFALPVRPAAAASLVVNSTADTVANDGACTLREAILNANSDNQSGSTDCAAGSGADTITFAIPAAQSGCTAANVCTITLSSAPEEIVDVNGLTIDGSGSKITLDGANLYRILYVGQSGSLTVRSLTFTRGVTIQRSDGAAILNAGSLSVDRSLFLSNSADGHGGAIASLTASLLIANSSFTLNRSNNESGALRLNGGTLINSTFKNNSGDDGVNSFRNFGGALTVTNNLFADGGNLDCQGSGVTNGGGNVTNDSSCPGTLVTDTAIQLSALADNGGPTQTFALGSSSAAVDVGSSTVCAAAPVNGLDQRGLPRNVDGNSTASANECDAGAYEYLSAPPPTTGTITVVKDVAGGTDPQDFSYNLYTYQPSFALLAQFQLDDDGDNSNTLSNTYSTTVSPGKYGVSEAAVANWSIAVDCESTDPNRVFPGPSFDPNNQGTGKAFDIAAGETITCTFTNTYTPPPTTGSIKVIKTVAGGAPGANWSFSGTAPISAFTLAAAGGDTTFSNLTPGSFTLTETRQGGWVPSVSCTPGSETGVASVTLDLSAGEAAECTFTNTQCQPGTFDNGGDACVPAPAGSFVSTAGATSAELCPAGRWQDQEGQTSCNLADPGFFVPEPGATVQTQCPPGTTSGEGATECTPIQAESFCPADDPAVGNELTTLIGRGMGSPTRALRQALITIPNAGDVTALYGQLTAVDVGTMKSVRFDLRNGTILANLTTPTSPAYRQAAVDWWGAELGPQSHVRGKFFPGLGASRAARGLVLWPTYETETRYANVLTTFDDSGTNYVHWSAGWVPSQTQTLDIPPTQAAGADITVHVALVDVQADGRPVVLTITPLPGGTPVERVLNRPNVPGRPGSWQNTLNLEEIVLAGVPAGVNRVQITLTSPGPYNSTYGTGKLGGDSAAMIGAAANYECGEVPGVPPVAQPDSYTFRRDLSQTIAASAGLFANNGSGPDDLGSPTATLVSFGGGDLGGAVTDHAAGAGVSFALGTLTVHADGSWTLLYRPFAPEVFTFNYRLQNAAGFSDGTVTLTINEGCLLNDLAEENDC